MRMSLLDFFWVGKSKVHKMKLCLNPKKVSWQSVMRIQKDPYFARTQINSYFRTYVKRLKGGD